MARRTNTAAAAAPTAHKQRRTRRAAAKPPVVQAPDTDEAGAERVAERVAAAQAAMPAVANWITVLGTALESLDDDGARAAADELITAATAVRRALNVRKSGTTPRPRTVPGQGEYVIVVDGNIVKDSAYKPSVARDVAVARKRVRDGEARPATDRYIGDEVMAQGKVMTRAEHEAAS
jgi:hypothetical protein